MMALHGEAVLSPDGKTFVLSVGNDFRVFDTADGKNIHDTMYLTINQVPR